MVSEGERKIINGHYEYRNDCRRIFFTFLVWFKTENIFYKKNYFNKILWLISFTYLNYHFPILRFLLLCLLFPIAFCSIYMIGNLLHQMRLWVVNLSLSKILRKESMQNHSGSIYMVLLRKLTLNSLRLWMKILKLLPGGKAVFKFPLLWKKRKSPNAQLVKFQIMMLLLLLNNHLERNLKLFHISNICKIYLLMKNIQSKLDGVLLKLKAQRLR